MILASQGSYALLPRPIEGALLDRVEVPGEEDDREGGEYSEDVHAKLLEILAVDNRPGVEKDDFDIEEDEEHRHEVELHAKARLGAGLRNHSALVGDIFSPSAAADPAQQEATHPGEQREADTADDMDDEGGKLRQLGIHKSVTRKTGTELGRMRGATWKPSLQAWRPASAFSGKRP